MVPPNSKKPNVWSRVFSRFSSRRGKAPIAQLEGSSPIAAGPTSSQHSSTRLAPGLSPPADAPKCPIHGSQPPISRSRSDAETFPALHHDDKRAAPEARGGTTSFFPGASGVRMGDIQYFEASHITVHSGGGVGDTSNDGWELLLKNIAPNALHDSSARYDAPKCDEDTRVEVTDEIMEWIQNPDVTQRLLCMTGAAGAGKSALQQTIAELCTKSGILSAAFFCSSTDPTRNTTTFIVPTIAYQIGLKHYDFRSFVAAAVKHDPNIFSRSLRYQMDALIVYPFESLRRIQKIDTNTFPYAILIDGLDECTGKYNATLNPPPPADIDDRRRAEDRQAELLAAIKHCILDNNLPFRVFIASRPEWAIRTALEPGGHLCQVAYHIELSEKYDASGDMRRYLRRRFEDIGLRIRDSGWFSEDAIEILVRAASGQFVYVATVYKYISERRSSPAERLRIVLAWTPHDGQVVRPFEALDRLYASILSTAKKAYEAVDTHHGRDFLLLFRAHHMNVAGFDIPSASMFFGCPADVLSALLGLEARAEDFVFSDLRSLVTLEKDHDGDLCLRLYHKSFSDFLEEESRAKELFVSESSVCTHLSKRCMQHIIECPLDFDSLPDQWDALTLPEQHRCSLKEAAEDLSFFLRRATALDDEIADFTHQDGWPKLEKLLLLAMADPKGWLRRGSHWEDWIKLLRRFTDKLAARKPEVAAIIIEFLGNLGHGREELDREMWDSSSDSEDSELQFSASLLPE
ncbi:hypothetical protein EST38_g1916 [Candolleomyces aberdarensis]|uniref:Nephrocystin 3-like N-terminal domain-containing protein n=1 Tax=Candolleomyces aberdarensis TaxID=2316362 RepID=A0A4Q2DUW7_9AGAR|nr:hypothetical protein EST38_g1916 [Candolleomyces aberdarensis]